jgi:hypothetical protein
VLSLAESSCPSTGNDSFDDVERPSTAAHPMVRNNRGPLLDLQSASHVQDDDDASTDAADTPLPKGQSIMTRSSECIANTVVTPKQESGAEQQYSLCLCI